MAENEKPSEPATPAASGTPGTPAIPPVPPKRSPGHRGADVKDTVAEMAAKAHEISLEAGSKMAAAMKDVINAAAGLTGFVIESARDLVQYMVRRGQMTQEEADKLIREVEAAMPKRKAGPLPRAPKKSGAAHAAAHSSAHSTAAARKHARSKPAAKKPAAKPHAKVVARKPAAKKAAQKKAPQKKAPQKKAPQKKAPQKKAPQKKRAPKKATPKKSALKKPASKKLAPAKRPAKTARKPAPKKGKRR